MRSKVSNVRVAVALAKTCHAYNVLGGEIDSRSNDHFYFWIKFKKHCRNEL